MTAQTARLTRAERQHALEATSYLLERFAEQPTSRHIVSAAIVENLADRIDLSDRILADQPISLTPKEAEALLFAADLYADQARKKSDRVRLVAGNKLRREAYNALVTMGENAERIQARGRK